MNDTVALLDKYRLALINDRDAFLVLALLLRNRSASSSDLADELGKSRARLATVVRDLYRAGWIRVAPSERYFLSDHSEALMAVLGMLDTGLESLASELLPGEYDRSVWGQVRRDSSLSQKIRCLHSFQIAAQSLTKNDSSLLARVLRVVLSELMPSRGQLRESSSANQGEAEQGRADEGDAKNLWTFWDRCELPVEPKARAVTIQGVFVLMVYWIWFEPGNDAHDRLLRRDAKCFKNMWSEFESHDQDPSVLFTKVLTHCVADYKVPSDRLTADDLLSEVRRRLHKKTNDLSAVDIDDCESTILRLLTSPKQP